MDAGKKLKLIYSLLWDYLGELAAIVPSRKNIFKTESSKIDLETKCWHLYRKLEAATYHCNNIQALHGKLERNIRKWAKNKMKGAKPGEKHQLEIESKKILFEFDAFLAAARSSLDFMASIISRYIRDKDTDEYRGLIKNLPEGPFKEVIVKNYEDWAKNLIDYRDYLLHRGIIEKAVACYDYTKNPDYKNSEIGKILQPPILKHKRPVICPLPRIPNPADRITRYEMFGMQEELPRGLNQTKAKVEIRLRGREVYRKEESAYEVSEGFIEARQLSVDYWSNTLNLALQILKELKKLEFRHR